MQLRRRSRRPTRTRPTATRAGGQPRPAPVSTTPKAPTLRPLALAPSAPAARSTKHHTPGAAATRRIDKRSDSRRIHNQSRNRAESKEPMGFHIAHQSKQGAEPSRNGPSIKHQIIPRSGALVGTKQASKAGRGGWITEAVESSCSQTSVENCHVGK
jgi:hypothetical protein